MRKGIKCVICGTKFDSIKENARYCSPPCKTEGLKLTRKLFNEAHPDYDRLRMKQTRAAKKQP